MTRRPAIALGNVASIAILVLTIAVAASWIIWSLHTSSALGREIDRQTELLQRLQARIADGSKPERPDEEELCLPGATAAIAGASLQSLVTETIQKAGGRLFESEVMSRPGQADVVDDSVYLRVGFSSGMDDLQRILFDLEHRYPIFVVSELVVHATEQGQQQSAETPLRTMMIVGGYWEHPDR